MTEHTDRFAELGQEEFELERRGYSRRQVDEFAAKARGQARQARELESRLSHALDENERLTGRFAKQVGFIMVRRRISVPQGELSAGRVLLSAPGGGTLN